MALDPLGYDAASAGEPVEQLLDIATIATASVANAEALRDLRVTVARAAHDANECSLALARMPDAAVADPLYIAAQILNIVVMRWARHFDGARGARWRAAGEAFIDLTRYTAQERV
jgi:hypothetical protein